MPTNTVSHPSSLVRAVNSETLSVGAYASKPASLRKSLTAWPQLPGTATNAEEEEPAATRTDAGQDLDHAFDGRVIELLDDVRGFLQMTFGVGHGHCRCAFRRR